MPDAPVTTVSSRSERIHSVDVLRGIIMIVMALDHVRDFLGQTAISPTDMTRASAGLFLTRWITHFCAPVFFTLTGTGAFLSLKKRGASDLSRFLFTRGLWLIFLEFVVVRCLGYQFNFDYRVTLLVILWALGWAMITLSALVRFPARVVAAFGIVLIAGHNAFDGVKAASFGAWAPLWSILHAPGFVSANPAHVIFVSYPIVPWIGVTAVGFALGRVFDWAPERRRAFLLKAGLGAIAAFLVLRGFNIYGDANPWTHARALSFLNVTKYPPSLLFLLMTLGPAMLALRALDFGTPQVLRPALVFGKVPLFYFLLHLPLIHLMAVAVCWLQNGDAHWMFESPNLGAYPFTTPPGWGLPLWQIYAAWILVVLILYPVCRWYGGVKSRNSSPWLSYL